MTILELGRTQPIPGRTTPYRPFIRRIVIGPFTPDADILAVSADLDESTRPTVSVTGVRDLAGAVYDRKLSEADMVGAQQSFFWDDAAQTLYVHLAPSENPFATTLLFGVAQGFSEGKLAYIDNIEYQPLILSAPAIRQQQDIENYDRLAFITGTIVLSNNDGRLDDLRAEQIYGNDVIMYHLDCEHTHGDNHDSADLTRIASLFVEDFDLSLNELSLRIQDRRKSQNASIPIERFELANYPDGGDIIGQVIPVLWGQARAIPAICTNKDKAGDPVTGNVTYRAALTLNDPGGLGTVQVKSDDDVWVDATGLEVNLATGEFEIDAGEARKTTGGQPREARLLNPTGIAITRITDIITDANFRFFNVDYTASNYDTVEWEAEDDTISTGAYYLDDEIELFDMIRDLQNGSNLGWRYEINAEGQRTIRVDKEDRAVRTFGEEDRTLIENLYILNRDDLRIETDSSTLAAEVVVAYHPDYESGRYLRYVDTGSLDEVLKEYGQRPRREYETVLTTEAAAIERAVYVRARFDRIRGIGEFVLMGKDFLTLRIYDIVQIEITPDASRAFYGTWKCKVLSVAPDLRESTNTITAVLIEEII